MATEIVTAPSSEMTPPVQTAPGMWESVVYERGRGRSVGTFDTADAAWTAAQDAARLCDAFGYTVIPASNEQNEGRTVADASRLVAAMQEFSSQALAPEQAKVFQRGLTMLEQTLMRGWAEVDEALVRLAVARKEKDAARAEDLRRCSVGMLHRWQGRNGRIGNVA
ncbi:MAG: hypothetical protein QM769_12060 [Pseudoxanthomonas sp.]